MDLRLTAGSALSVDSNAICASRTPPAPAEDLDSYPVPYSASYPAGAYDPGSSSFL